nr:MAG: CHASE2 domain-containing protein [Hyphomicrobiales bacterium]
MSADNNAAPKPEPQEKKGFIGRFRNPDETQIRRFAAQTPFLWVYLIVLLIATFQIYADPLGFDGLTERYSQQLVNLTLTGPLYPNTGRDQVSVALLEDDTLAELDLLWPWPYGEHARALDAILAYEPRAVAVDILFADARDDPSLEQLLFVIERYARFGVPLYFVGSPNVNPPVRVELSNSSARIVAGTINLAEGVARQYPESVNCLNGRNANCPSLAIRIFQDLYANVPLSGDAETALELVWGVDTHPINRQLMRVVDGQGNAMQCPTEAGIITRIYRALVDVDQLRSPCPHTGVIPLESLLFGVPDDDIQTLIKDRIVFYGAKLEGSEDLAFSPANGLLAGVFVHAMALDNIISFEGRPKRNTITLSGVTLGNDTIKVIVAAIILLVVASLNLEHLRKDASTPGDQDLTLRRRFTWYGILLAMTLGSVLGLYFIFDLSISNWIELVFITGLLFELLISSFLGRLWGRTRYAFGL